MSAHLTVNPFDATRHLGTTSFVGPTEASVTLAGENVSGQVGEFVAIDASPLLVFGRVASARLPQSSRPTAEVRLLASVDLESGRVSAGLLKHPRLGANVYSASPDLVRYVAESGPGGRADSSALTLKIASVPAADETGLHLSPERLFGRHCAILGATGGGKSWTLARLLEESIEHHSKMILLDATGEFHTLHDPRVRHVTMGEDSREPKADEVCFPHAELTEGDLLALFRPSGQSQAPRLRAAMKSLKLARLAGPELGSLLRNGLVHKAGSKRSVFEDAEIAYARELETEKASFDINLLARQVEEECVWPSGTLVGSEACWGPRNEDEYSNCVSLVTRVEEIVTSGDLSCLFDSKDKKTLPDEIESFLESDSEHLLRVSMRPVPFAHDAREIVTNAIGRYLLDLGRRGVFRQCPVVVVLEEAHQFLSRELGDESARFQLDAFDLIAKEGRKFSLNICLATQRPRDIPEGVLSQVGTMLVHRTTNDRDREIVERACGDIDRSAAAFLPTLAPGQAVIIGIDFPIPVTVDIRPPSYPPDSRGPDFQAHWKRAVRRATS